MRRNISFVFNDAAQASGVETPRNDTPLPGLKFIIRTDAAHATFALKSHIAQAMQDADPAAPVDTAAISAMVHGAYREWGHKVLEVMADCLDYGRYGVTAEEDKNMNVYFYNARSLARSAVRKADEMVAASGDYAPGAPVVYVSLDEMIDGSDGYWSPIAFSRHFSLTGDQHFGYMARPGKKPLEDQIRDLCDLLERAADQHGGPVPIVLMEDNVRYAKMLNWVIDLLDRGGVFQNGRLAGISTCFCCATDAERDAIRHDGRVVPLTVVVDYGAEPIDVTTTRDLLFDGAVVKAGANSGRLPVLFMDLEKMFKIRADKADEFRARVKEINVDFCRDIEAQIGMELPLRWFAVADAVTEVTGASPDTPMVDILRQYLPDSQGPKASPLPPPLSAGDGLSAPQPLPPAGP